MTKIAIVDDTLRRNPAVPVTPDMRSEMGLAPHVKIVTLKGRGPEAVRVHRTYEGRHLELALARARRWLRNAHRRRLPARPPRHILLALAVMAKAEPEEFERMRAGA